MAELGSLSETLLAGWKLKFAKSGQSTGQNSRAYPHTWKMLPAASVWRFEQLYPPIAL